MRILAVAHNLLFPQHDGGSGHLLNLLTGFVRLGCEVDYFARNPQSLNADSAELGAAIRHLQAAQIRVHLPTPQAHFQQFMEQEGASFDLVLLWPEGLAMDAFPLVKQHAPQALVVFNTIDLAHIRSFRKAKVENSFAGIQSAMLAKRRETWLARHADCALVVSETERETLLQLAPGADIRVLPHLYTPLPNTTPFAQRQGLLFVGSFPYAANGDAVLYFVNEILPLVRAALPAVHLYIVGATPPTEVEALKSDTITVTGYVETIDPYFERVRLSIAPLRYGAGVKNKILHSMARAVPVVTTSIGAEGMHLEDGVNVLVGDDAQSFANAVIRLHEDETLWSHIVAHLHSTIEAHFSQQRLDQVLGDLLHTTTMHTETMHARGLYTASEVAHGESPS